jgi:manganese-dependent inorganic pyrophosphatase
MLTDILEETSEMIYAGAQAKELLINCFGEMEKEDRCLLKGVVSRKKQLIPVLIAGLQQKKG